MEEFSREEKIEAIEGICKYDKKLADAVEVLADEIEDGISDIHSEVFGQVMQGVNWTVEILQKVMDIMDEKDKKLDKEFFNDALTSFDQAYKAEDEEELVFSMRRKLAPAIRAVCDVGEQFF